jgi:hypothetical protein
VVAVVVVRTGHGKVVGMVKGALILITEVTTTIPTTTTTAIGTEATTIGGRLTISRRVPISKLHVIMGKLVRLGICLEVVMLVGLIHQLMLFLSL